MSRYLKMILMGIVVVGFVSCSTENRSSTADHGVEQTLQKREYYTCSMHPQIREQSPGQCPICGMNLIKVTVDQDTTSHSDHETKESITDSPKNIVASVKLKKAQMKHFQADIFPVTPMRMEKKVRLLGSILTLDSAKSNISTRVSGRIDRVYVDSVGSRVSVGDRVVDIYSPELITAGEEYILARKSYEKNRSKVFKKMLEQSTEKLQLWGIQKYQYSSWYKKGKVPKDITIHSNSQGVVIALNASVGKYFKEGEDLFTLWDLGSVWVEMDVYESDASLVKLGQKIELSFSSLPGVKRVGVIDFINPFLDKRSRTLKVRTTIKNSEGAFKPGMVANAVLNIMMESRSLVVPRTAVIDTGTRKVVWVKKDDDLYQAKEIETGYESEGYIEVSDGLEEAEEVVIEGNFLLDAQAQLFGGYEDMKESDVHMPHH